MSAFRNKIRELINEYSMEQQSDTPDFVLAKYLEGCLNLFNQAIFDREAWYGRQLLKDSERTTLVEGED